MKIVYVRTQFSFNLKAGGSVAHTLGILSGFKKSNCELSIISNERFWGIDDFDYSIIEPKFKRPLGELFYNFYAGRSIKRKLLEVRPDFIYHRYTGYTFFVSKIAKKLGIPLILEFNSFHTWTMKHWGKNKGPVRRFLNHILYNMVKRIEAYNLKNASLIIAVSQPLKMDLLKMGIPEERILVSPNGVDPDKFTPEIEKSEKCKELRQGLGVANKIVVGFSGTFGPWHGIPQLTKAIDKILRDKLLPNIHFLLMGDGVLKPGAENRLGHYSDVTFTGTVPYSEIQDYLAICDILISPHNPQVDGREFFGSPTKLFEYMAMGRGIVASNLGQIGEALGDESAILVEPGNEEQLVQGILKLAAGENLRKHLGKQARQKAISDYTWEQNTGRIIQTCKALGIAK